MQAQALSGGFSSPPVQSAHAFRAIMQAMARPGSVQSIEGAEPPAPLSVAAGSVLLTLCDTDTPVYLAGDADCPEIRAWLAFHTGAPIVDPARSMFAYGSWEALMPLDAYPIGTAQYPDRSATLIVEHPTLMNTHTAQMRATLRGPGIQDQAELNVPERDAFIRNRALFPLGLDFIFTQEQYLAALPRTTEVS